LFSLIERKFRFKQEFWVRFKQEFWVIHPSQAELTCFQLG
jgi:hypothetical protein